MVSVFHHSKLRALDMLKIEKEVNEIKDHIKKEYLDGQNVSEMRKVAVHTMLDVGIDMIRLVFTNVTSNYYEQIKELNRGHSELKEEVSKIANSLNHFVEEQKKMIILGSSAIKILKFIGTISIGLFSVLISILVFAVTQTNFIPNMLKIMYL